MFSDNGSFNNDYKKGQDIFKSVIINLSDIYKEKTIIITYENREINHNHQKCKNCDGSGYNVNVQQMGPMLMQTRNKCQHCDNGYINLYNDIIDTFQLKLNRLHDINKKIIISNKGLPLYEGLSGDLIIKLNFNHDNKNMDFKIKNYNLHHNLNISFKESLLGFTRSLMLPDDRIIKIESNVPVNNDTIKYIENEGLYSDDIKDFGSIILKIKVLLPSKLTEEQRNIVDKYFD